MIDKDIKAYVIGVLRRGTYRFRARSEALKAGRIGRGKYICKMCGINGPVWRRKDVFLDHKIPVVGKEGFTNFDDYIERMYCPVENWQILCKDHHDKKTAEEKEERKKFRELRKQEEGE